MDAEQRQDWLRSQEQADADRAAWEVAQVLDLADQEARDMGHHIIGTQHLLLGLLRFGGPVAAELGVTIERVREEVARIVAGSSGEPPAERVLRWAPAAAEAARGLGGAESLAFWLRETPGVAYRILADLAPQEDEGRTPLPTAEAIVDALKALVGREVGVGVGSGDVWALAAMPRGVLEGPIPIEGAEEPLAHEMPLVARFFGEVQRREGGGHVPVYDCE